MLDRKLAQIQKWREAHPDLQIPEASLMVAGPFPSLFASDFCVMLESKGVMPEVVSFVRDISREMIWAYDNWKKVFHDSDPAKLMIALIEGARAGGGPGGEQARATYLPIHKFLTDYARANNIKLDKDAGYASWEDLLADPTIVEGLQPEGKSEITDMGGPAPMGGIAQVSAPP